MKADIYTSGHSANATAFMAKRSFDSHGLFFAQYLGSGSSILDCGCGPGSITIGIAERVYPGSIVGVDVGTSQLTLATSAATARAVSNVSFKSADCYSLPFDAKDGLIN